MNGDPSVYVNVILCYVNVFFILFLCMFQALNVDPTDCYNVHWPIRHGRFNLHSGVGGTATAIAQDLEEIWANAIHTLLEIPVKDLKVTNKQTKI